MRRSIPIESELLRLLNGREAWKLPEYRRPQFDPAAIHIAASAHAACETSDPFAYGRMALHIARGYELPSEVLLDSRKRKGIGDARIPTPTNPFVRALAPVKRRIDADRSWNQHNSAKYRGEA